MSQIIETTLGFTADTLFRTYNYQHWLPMFIRRRFFHAAFWMLDRNLAVKQWFDEGKSDRTQWWGDW